MLLKLKIWWLKRRLRSTIIRFEENYSFWQCGNKLLDEVTGGRYSRDRAAVQGLKEKLKAIDPNYPI